jgi:uncharacterized membrane protein
MTIVHKNELVAAYLRRLEQAAAQLPRARRAELVAEIREHIDDALLEAGAADEVAVRNVLERLGPPEEIAAAAGPPATVPARAGRLEIAALITLAVPFAGWLVGIPLVLISQAWAGRDKVIAVALGLSPLFVGALGIVATRGGNGVDVPVGTPVEPATGGLGPLEVGILSLGFLGGLVGAVYLALRLRRTASPRAQEV